MADVALGIDSNFGFGEEGIYGTRVVPSQFLPITSESLQLNQTFTPINVLGAAYDEYYVDGKRSVAGSVEFGAIYGKQFGTLLKHALGDVTSVSAGGITTHSIKPSGTILTGLSLYVDRDANTVGTAYSYNGCQVSKLSLTQEAEQTLNANVEFMGKDETEVSYVAPTIARTEFIDWTDFSSNITISGVAAAFCAKSFALNINNALASDRYCLGSKLKTSQGLGGKRTIDGSFTVEFTDKSQYQYFRNGNELSGVFSWTGPSVSGLASVYSFSVDIPRMKVGGTTPNIAGPDAISLEIPFTAYYQSGMNYPLKATLVNTNSTL